MVTTVSAPGKALVAGGYLVLDPTYFGVVFATDARFYTSVASFPQRDTPRIRVRSPQFLEAEWVYDVVLPAMGSEDELTEGLQLVQVDENGKNPFVALSLLYVLHLGIETLGDALRSQLGGGLDIVIAGDNDYYSHRVELQALPPFAPQHCTLSNVHKTGLGSSAAMTTSLTAGVLMHLGITKGESEDEAMPLASLGLIHNTAQLAHCAAQGKVGSGFDVSSSVWGNQLYRRFDPSLIKDVMREESGFRIVRTPTETEKRPPIHLLPVLDPRNPLWQPAPQDANGVPTAVEGMMEIARSSTRENVARPAPLQLPPGIRMCLADVDAGSNTPTLVGQVSAFRKNKPEWAANQSLADGLLGLHVACARDKHEYARVLTALAQRSSSEWDAYRKEHPSLTADMFIDVRNSMRSVRGGMRELGVRAGAPVEPMEMSRLLDTTIRDANGILGGGVPGAGGYDALFLLFLHPDSLSAPDERVYAPSDVCAIWSEWSELSVGPLLCGADHPGVAGTDAGPVLEDMDPAVASVLRDLQRTRAGLRVERRAVDGLEPLVASLGA